MKKPVLFLLIVICLPMVGCASSTKKLKERKIDNLTSFFLEIQEYDFSKSIKFCAEANPEIEVEFRRYLAEFKIGAQMGIEEKSKDMDLRSMDLSDADKKAILATQAGNGDLLLSKIKEHSDRGCPYLAHLISSSTAREDAKKLVISIGEKYEADRKKYCSQNPKPESCP